MATKVIPEACAPAAICTCSKAEASKKPYLFRDSATKGAMGPHFKADLPVIRADKDIYPVAHRDYAAARHKAVAWHAYGIAEGLAGPKGI
jgi:hypothetical protein